MEAILLYILKTTVCLTILYVAYKSLLAKETFFGFNRAVLLVGIAVSLGLPFVTINVDNVPSIVSQIENITFVNETPTMENVIESVDMQESEDEVLAPNLVSMPHSNKDNTIAQKNATTIPWFKLITIFYLVGVVINIIALLISYFRMMRLINSGEERTHNNLIYCAVNKNIAPFSWGKYIVLSENEKKEIEAIITHEEAHIQRLHFLDILFSELVLSFHWFNPFAWKLKQELKDIHEFQADSDVINSGINASKYQLLILEKAVGTSSYALANSFNHSKIKKRITMMLKQKSKSWNRAKLLLLIPLALLAVYAFSCTESKSNENMGEPKIITLQDDSIQRAYHLPILDKDTKRMASSYGMRIDPIYGTRRLHPGIDFTAPSGTTIYAVKDGEVIEAVEEPKYGNIVKIAHGNDVETWYAHNQENLVKKGDKVKTGQPIALVGNSGIATGSHLHFEVRILGIPVNPFDKKMIDMNASVVKSDFFDFLINNEDKTPSNTKIITIEVMLEEYTNQGDTVYASKNGVVREINEDQSDKKTVIVQHFDNSETKYTNCTHIFVNEGYILYKGDPVAASNRGKNKKFTPPTITYDK